MPTMTATLPELGDQYLSTATIQSFSVIGAIAYYFLVIQWHQSRAVQLLYWEEFDEWLDAKSIIKL